MQRDVRQRILICLLLAVVTLLVYAPVRRFDFINYDDPKLVTGNPHVSTGLTTRNMAWAFTTSAVEYWHPLTWLSHMLDCQLFGLDAGAHHAVNVLLHILNALLLFAVLHRATGRLWRSGFVAVLFALHPLHVESVAWIAERKDVLSTLCWMLALWAYIRYVAQPSLGLYAVVTGFFALGLMSKPMVVTLPVILLLLDVWPLRRPRTAGLVWEKIPLFVLAALATVVTFLGAQHSGQVSSAGALPLRFRISNAIVSYLRYIARTFWPDGLAIYYPFHAAPPLWAVTASAALLVLATAVAILMARRRPYVLTGWGWYLVTLSPVILMIHGASPTMADRYTYVPLIGIFVLVTWLVPDLLANWPHRNIALTALAAAVIIACGVASGRQLQYWRDTRAVFERALAVTEGNFVAHAQLGYLMAQQGQTSEAMRHYETALRIRPGYPVVQYNLGLLLAQQGNLDGAVEHFSKAVELNPQYGDAHNNLGNALRLQGKFDEAIAHFNEALRLDPNSAAARNNLALAEQSKRETTGSAGSQ